MSVKKCVRAALLPRNSELIGNEGTMNEEHTSQVDQLYCGNPV